MGGMMKTLKILMLGAMSLSTVAAFAGGSVLLDTPANMTLVTTTSGNTNSSEFNYGPKGTATIYGMADFDGNGMPDLMVRDGGTLRLWMYSFTTVVVKTVTDLGVPQSSSAVGVGAGNLRSDENLEVAVQDSTTKLMTFYTINKVTLALSVTTSTTPYSGSSLPNASEYDTVVAVGDFHKARKDQIMVQNTNPASAEYRYLRIRTLGHLLPVNEFSAPISGYNLSNVYGPQAPTNPVAGSMDLDADGYFDIIIDRGPVTKSAKRAWTLKKAVRQSNVVLWNPVTANQPYLSYHVLAVGH
jgi:hypothetical protein